MYRLTHRRDLRRLGRACLIVALIEQGRAVVTPSPRAIRIGCATGADAYPPVIHLPAAFSSLTKSPTMKYAKKPTARPMQ